MSKIELNPNKPSEEQILEEKHKERIKERIFELMFGESPNKFFGDPNLEEDPDMRDSKLLEKVISSLSTEYEAIRVIFNELSGKPDLLGLFFDIIPFKLELSEKKGNTALFPIEENPIERSIRKDPIGAISSIIAEAQVLSMSNPLPHEKELKYEKEVKGAVTSYLVKKILERTEDKGIKKYLEEEYKLYSWEFPSGLMGF